MREREYRFKYYKSKMIILFIVLLFSSCREIQSNPNNFKGRLFQKVHFDSLGINTSLPKLTPFSRYEEEYIHGEYGQIFKRGNLEYDDLNKTDSYIYFQSLSHLKEWQKLYIQIKNEQSLFKDSLLGVYFVGLYLESCIQTNNLNEAKSVYFKYEKLLATYKPYRFIINLIDNLAAHLNNSSLAKTQGGFYFYRYMMDKKNNFPDYKRALTFYNSQALSLLNVSTFFHYVNPKDPKIAGWAKNNFAGLYVAILKKNREWEKLAAYYFHKSQYQAVLRVVKSGFYYNMSKLMKSKKVSESIIRAALKNLKASSYYLASYYFNNGNYEALSNIALQSKVGGVLRYLIVLGLNEKHYQNLYMVLKKKLETQQLSSSDFYMSLYWLGYLSHRLGYEAPSRAYYINLASKHPNSYYGWEALKSLTINDIEHVADNWRKLSSQVKGNYSSFISSLKSANLPLNRDLKLTLFFLKIRENQKGKLYLHSFLSSLSHKRYYYLALAKAFYANRRMDYFLAFGRYIQDIIDQETKLSLIYKDLLFLTVPTLYEDIIKKSAKHFNIDESSFQSLILQESNYDFRALSWVGAKGLSQLMGPTAKPIMKTLLKKGLINNQDLFDPHTNLMVGGNYFGWLYNRVYKNYPQKDRLILSFASYNAGPRRIKKMYSTMKNKENISHFIESITFAESRYYAKILVLKKDFYYYFYHFNG
jgi:soluble lytic murein transglycosylase-like protein